MGGCSWARRPISPIRSCGQLAGFLAYDVVLIGPFLSRLPSVDPEFRTSLIVYTIVISYSALLAIYYLFINPQTRIFSARIHPAQGAAY